MKEKLTLSAAENNRKVKEIEDKILFLLANSKGDILASYAVQRPALCSAHS